MPERIINCVPSRLLAAALMFVALAAQAQPGSQLPDEEADWSLKKESGQIRVYTTSHPGSTFQAFKAEALLDAPLNNLMAVMANPESCVEWVHGCVESYGFGDGEFHDRYAYSVNNMPWPVTDRDYALRIRTEGSRAAEDIIMKMNAAPDQRAEDDQYVRVDRSNTFYRFIPEGDKTRMVWIQHTDPNGSLPSWLVNSLLVDIPIKSMEQLERVARTPRYQNHQLIYNDAGNLSGVAGSDGQSAAAE